LKNKGHKNHPQKKGTSVAFCAGPLTQKTKKGRGEQGKAAQVSFDFEKHHPT
jgi:hypothetical protein